MITINAAHLTNTGKKKQTRFCLHFLVLLDVNDSIISNIEAIRFAVLLLQQVSTLQQNNFTQQTNRVIHHHDLDLTVTGWSYCWNAGIEGHISASVTYFENTVYKNLGLAGQCFYIFIATSYVNVLLECNITNWIDPGSWEVAFGKTQASPCYSTWIVVYNCNMLS